MTTEAVNPKTYLDRKTNSAASEYVFVSYSHASQKAVFADLDALYDKGLNYWYDAGLHPGDEWNKIVDNIVGNPKCRGLLFFFDINCLSGDAIEQEIDIYEKYRQLRPDLFAFCLIAASDESVYAIVRNALAKTVGLSNRELQTVLPETRVIKVLKAFNKDKIYILKQGDYLDAVIRNLRELSPFLVQDDQSDVNELKSIFGPKSKIVDGIHKVVLGSYPQTVALTHTHIYRENSVFEEGDRRFLDKYNSAFAFGALTWIVLEIHDGKATLISDQIIDTVLGEKEALTHWMDLFADLALSGNVRDAMIGPARLPSLTDVEKLAGLVRHLKATELALKSVIMPVDIAAWLADVEGIERKILCGFDAGSPDVDFNYTDSYAGVMPLIEIDLAKLKGGLTDA